MTLTSENLPMRRQSDVSDNNDDDNDIDNNDDNNADFDDDKT